MKRKNRSDLTQNSLDNETYERQYHESNTLKGLIQEQKWVAVIKYLSSHNFNDNSSITILHVACATPTIPSHVIHAIIQSHPNACLTKDEDDYLPIHVACSTPGVSLLAIEHLMNACPESCLGRYSYSFDGKIPLYLFLENNDSVHIEALVCRLLMRLSASCIYNETTSLIHEVCKCVLPESIIHKIISMYPQVCQIKSKNGDTLLHILCSHSYLTPRTLYTITQHYPEACAKMDNDGNLPLHRVNPGIHPESTIRLLIKEHPRGIYTSNIFGLIPRVTQYITHIKPILGFSDITTAISSIHPRNRAGLGLVSIQDSYYEMQCDLTCFITHSRRNASLYLNPKSYPKLEDQIASLFYLVTRYVYGCIDTMDSGSSLNVPHQPFFWTRFPLFVRMLLQQAPLIAKKKDKYGELPLHTIVKHSFDMSRIRQCSICSDLPISGPFLCYGDKMQVCTKCYTKSTDSFWNSPSFNRLPLLEYQQHEIIKDVVNAYPQAASIPDRFGRLPLQSSLRAGSTWYTGVKEIFEAAPNSIYIQDYSPGLFPCMIAACKKSRTDADRHPTKALRVEQVKENSSSQKGIDLLELATIFELLQKDPSQVKI